VELHEDGRPPNFDLAVQATWQPGCRLPGSLLDDIAAEARLSPLDDPCVWWDKHDPGQLNVSIGLDGTLDEAGRRGARHLRDVLLRHDPQGQLIHMVVMSETHSMVWSHDQPS
jgi:hypothetical protein